MPVLARAGQPRHLQAQHQPHMAHREFCDQPREPGPLGRISGRPPQVLIDHHHPGRRPAQRDRPVYQPVLQPRRLAVVQDLLPRRLPDRYSRAVLARWAAVTFEEAVSVSTGAPSPPRDGARSWRQDRSGAGQRDGEPGQGMDELGGHRQRQRRPGRRCWCSCGAGGGGAGQAGQGAPPGGDALAGEHAEAERERARACVQGGMTQLLVAGVQPAAGNMSLAGIRARG